MALGHIGQSGLSLTYGVVSQLGGDIVEGPMTEDGVTGDAAEPRIDSLTIDLGAIPGRDA